MKDQMEEIDRKHFAALMYRMLELCYPDIWDRVYMLGRPAKYLFGINTETVEQKNESISGIINNSGRAETTGNQINEYWDIYAEGNAGLFLKKSHYRNYLDFAQLKESSLTVLADELQTKLGPYFPPKDLRRMRFLTESWGIPNTGPAAERLASGPTFSENIEGFARSKWFFYFYEYESVKPCLIRLVLSIQKEGQDYKVKIENTSDKYTTYKGKILEMTDRRLRMELYGDEGKTMNFMAHTDAGGESEIYLGKLMKNGAGVVSCSVILHRIPDDKIKPKADIFYFDEVYIHQNVPLAIQNFFAVKPYVYTNVTKIYSLEELERWLIKKQRLREEDIVRHVFLSAPFRAVDDQRSMAQNIKLEIRTLIKDAAGKPDNLCEQIEAVVDKHMKSTASNNFKADVLEFRENLEKTFQIQAYFAPAHPEYMSRTRKSNLKEEWRQLCRSHAFVLIVPENPVFSSSWVILGWAMARRMPIFILSFGDNAQGLPNMVRSIEVEKNVEYIDMADRKLTLSDAIEMLKDNKPWMKIMRLQVAADLSGG